MAHWSVGDIGGGRVLMAMKSDALHPFLILSFVLLQVSLLDTSNVFFRWFETKLSKNDSIEPFYRESISVVHKNLL